MKINEDDYAVLLRESLALFTERVFNHLYPNTPFLGNWHIDLIASEIEGVLNGNTRRLIINVPPRSLKSVLASISAVAWQLGRHPQKEIICVSYGQSLAEKLAEDCRNIMTSDWYFRIFGVRLKGARPAISDFKTEAGGGRFATSVGGVLTGRGGDILIIDDPLKPDEAMSEVARNNANHWIMHTAMSRLNDKKAGAVIIIMQRLHEEDLVGHVQDLDDWRVISLPAIAETEQHFEYETLWGKQEHVRYIGDVLHLEREPLEVLDKIKQNLGEYNFAGQYQQSPAPMGGGMFKLEWFRYCSAFELPESFDQIFQSWDTASKETEMSDYSVCTTWGIKQSKRYLLDVYRARMDYPTLKRAVISQFERFNPSTILIEDKASGIQLIQELRSDKYYYAVKAYKPQGDKVMRAHAQTGAFEGGFILLPQEAPWLGAYINELMTFPRGKHDDQVDSTAQFLEWVAINGLEPGGVWQYYKQLHESRQMEIGIMPI